MIIVDLRSMMNSIYLESTIYNHLLEDGRSSTLKHHTVWKLCLFVCFCRHGLGSIADTEPLGTDLENPMFSCPEAKRAGSTELVGSILFLRTWSIIGYDIENKINQKKHHIQPEKKHRQESKYGSVFKSRYSGYVKFQACFRQHLPDFWGIGNQFENQRWQVYTYWRYYLRFWRPAIQAWCRSLSTPKLLKLNLKQNVARWWSESRGIQH